MNVYLPALGITCALGRGADEVAATLFAADAARGVADDTTTLAGRSFALGRVRTPLPTLDHLPRPLQGRNNALLADALAQLQPAIDAALERHGASRIGVVVGTSTSGVAESERAHRLRATAGAWPEGFHYAQQEMGAPAEFVATMIGSRGPAYTISTACSSSAKAVASAARLLRTGVVDAVVCGGADSLCAFTVAGFSALGAVSDARCNPFSANRRGINVGEGAALFLMTRTPSAVRLAGAGESSDAHHMSAPDPSGAGASCAIEQALARAGVHAGDVDYVNLHGTATLQNDAMESAVVQRLFGDVPASSTKPLSGHALGAAGALEAAFCWLALQRSDAALPPHWWDGVADPALPALALVAPGARAPRRVRHALSNSFAFGGNNAALLLAGE